MLCAHGRNASYTTTCTGRPRSDSEARSASSVADPADSRRS